MRPVTQPSTLGQLVQMPEREAIRAHIDEGNCQTFFRLLAACVLAAIVLALAAAFEERYAGLLGPALNLALVQALFAVRERPVLTRFFRLFLVGFLLVQGVLWRFSVFEPLATVHPADFVAPAMVVLFRLPAGLLAIPLGAFWAMASGRNLVAALSSDADVHYPLVVFQSALVVLVFSIVQSLTARDRREFLVRWRREAHRRREQRRMETELDDARKIQLSMLPRSEPKIAWLDVAGISIPASEVGGDYYDYFTLGERRQAIVVGDVAGHGVASGLVLSGVRSCLHLLQESPTEPREILTRIDRVVRRTARHRSFMTLLYSVFDHEEGALTFASAGHPPPLHRDARGVVEELETHALPLGTQLGTQPVQRRVPFAPGDVFVFFTDGIAETVNARGELFGDERLADRLRTISAERTAKEIRDTVLGDVWSFKADGEQLDDITLIVAKLR